MSGRARAAIVLQALAAGAIGVLLGAEIAEGALLVPWWREMPAGEFLAWYAAHAERLLRFFAPLTTAATALALAAAVTTTAMRGRGRVGAIVAAVLVVLVVAGFFVYFEDANHRFATGAIPHDEVASALATWAHGHWARVVAIGVAFGASLWSLARD